MMMGNGTMDMMSGYRGIVNMEMVRGVVGDLLVHEYVSVVSDHSSASNKCWAQLRGNISLSGHFTVLEVNAAVTVETCLAYSNLNPP